MLYEIKKKKLLRDGILSLKAAVSGSNVYLPAMVSKFVFLCGANKSDGTISERRKALIGFSKSHLEYAQFFLAERVFSTLQDEGHKENILDVEHEITQFADHIIIVLESPSSYTELGAFSHNDLRKKLIVINDDKFKAAKSFINLGPIQAIEEAAGKNKIIHYKMSPDGVDHLDAIGDTFLGIFNLLKDPIKTKRSPIDLVSCNPSQKFTKISVMFVHDLVYFTGPITYKELIEILKIIFGDGDFKLRQHLAILSAFASIERDGNGLFRSRLGKTYYYYRFDSHDLMAIFRNYILKGYPERLYAH
ncbi:MAG: retron St85 family effector protein [Moraxellaceae bacterium]|nr:retron St85 family effector protein [Moraxellaceae bacterium]